MITITDPVHGTSLYRVYIVYQPIPELNDEFGACPGIPHYTPGLCAT